MSFREKNKIDRLSKKSSALYLKSFILFLSNASAFTLKNRTFWCVILTKLLPNVMNHFLILYLVLPCRGSTSSRYGPLDPLPGGCISFSHHRDRLPDEAHLDDNDGCLQVCQDQEAHHLPQPQLHGPAAGVRGGPQQRDNATDPYAKADWCGNTCLNRLALASRWFFFCSFLLFFSETCSPSLCLERGEPLCSFSPRTPSTPPPPCLTGNANTPGWWRRDVCQKISTVWSWTKSRSRPAAGCFVTAEKQT